IAVAEVPDVCRGEGFTLAETAARIGKEDEAVFVRKQRKVEERSRPRGFFAGPGPAVHGHHHGVALGGIIIYRVEQPALDFHPVIRPMDAFGLAPAWMNSGVVARDLLPGSDLPRPDLGGLLE